MAVATRRIADMSAAGSDAAPTRVPGYAWAWLQRSRPVLAEAALRLTGAGPSPDFIEQLRADFPRDAFTREVLLGAIADVAFSGRIPQRRLPGSSWDRGLTWWAAVLAGCSVAEFEARTHPLTGSTPELFASNRGEHRAEQTDGGPSLGTPGGTSPAEPPRALATPERAAAVRALRQLLAHAEGDTVPAHALRELLAAFEGGDREP
jgi:hypothetical protein